MKQTLLILSAVTLLLSCGNADTAKNSGNTSTSNQRNDTAAATKTKRELIIEELKRLQEVFASNDKEKIADIFRFPISDTTVGIYIDDSTFNEQYEQNGNKATRAMFIRHFKDIATSIETEQLNQLFKKINIERLSQTDKLDHDAIIKSDPCYHFYGVKIENNIVTLTVGTNSNKNWKSKSVSNEKIPENSSEFCEHVLWWVFRFDGEKLHLKNISGAG